MLDVDAISSAMNEIRYTAAADVTLTDVTRARARLLLNKASWTPDNVEHFVRLQVYKGRLTARFEFRNPVAEAFALQSIKTHGGDAYELMLARRAPTDCTMTFDIARLVSPGCSWSLRTASMPGSQLAESVAAVIEIHVIPFVDSTLTIEAVLSRLLADDEPCRWFVTNAAIRYAQIVALGMMTGMTPEQVRTALKLYGRELSYVHKIGNPADYAERLIEDWRSFQAT